MSEAEETALGWAFMLFVLAPIIAGVATSGGARHPKLHNPLSVWIPWVWSRALLVGALLMVLAGICME